MQEMSEYFYLQALGDHSGDMAFKPNNPFLKTFFAAAGVYKKRHENSYNERKALAQILHEIAFDLEREADQKTKQDDDIPF